jgi:hypothetical protein
MVRKNKVTLLAEQLRQLLHDSPDKLAPFKSARKTAAEFGVSRQTADRALRMLAEEGVLTRIPGAGTWQRGNYKRRYRVACMIAAGFHETALEPYSDLPERYNLLVNALTAAQFELEFFSYRELRDENFSPRIFDNFDALLAEGTYCDCHSRRLVCEFNKPKVWLETHKPSLEPDNQVISDFVSGFIGLFRQARKSGIRHFCVHLVRPYFGEIIGKALELTGYSENEVEIRHAPEITPQLAAYKYGLNLPVEPDLMHVCDLDISACGIYEALLDRKFQPGEIALSGVGNIESLGFLPFGKPVLTTVATPRREMAQAAAELLLHKLKHPENHSTVVRVPAYPVFRSSAFSNDV